MIDIGQNDLLQALYGSNLTYTTVVEKIPPMLLEIKKAIQVLVSFSNVSSMSSSSHVVSPNTAGL